MGVNELISSVIWILVPLCALGIPLMAVIGHVIVKPVVAAISRLADTERAAMNAAVITERLTALDDRLARMERQIDAASRSAAGSLSEQGARNHSIPIDGSVEVQRLEPPPLRPSLPI